MYAICIAPQVNYSTSEALNMDHTAFYTANTPCRLYRVVRQGEIFYFVKFVSQHYFCLLHDPSFWDHTL